MNECSFELRIKKSIIRLNSRVLKVVPMSIIKIGPSIVSDNILKQHFDKMKTILNC